MSTPAPLPMVEDIFVSMVAGVCATCRWWDTGPWQSSYGGCGAITEDSDAAWMNADSSTPILYTRENFGCRLWSAKGK